MFRILTVVGARPQFIKAAAISRVLQRQHADQVQELIVHTGQHYDADMSEVFFHELGIPRPAFSLSNVTGSHAERMGAMMTGLERIIANERPDLVLLYGDTDSTLAGALTANRAGIPIAHVEGGVRSRYKAYPEETNRLLTDHLSTLIFCPGSDGMGHLEHEGLNHSPTPWSADTPGTFQCGDIMYDNSLFFAEQAARTSTVLNSAGVATDGYALITLHRPHNVDDPKVLAPLLEALLAVSEKHELPLVWPVHPRTRQQLGSLPSTALKNRLHDQERIKLLPPAGYLDMVQLERNARIVLTDSGGVQKEAYFFQRPAVVLLDPTPWPELVRSGSAVATGNDPARIIAAAEHLLAATDLTYPPIFGDGRAAEFICDRMLELLQQRIAR